MAIPELDDVLYRVEVLQLEMGSDERPPQDLSELEVTMPEPTSAPLPRSESTTTSISANVRSGSASATSHGTSITSRSSHDGGAQTRQSASIRRRPSLPKSQSTTDYERFLAQAEQALKKAGQSPAQGSTLSLTSPLASPSASPLASPLLMTARKPYVRLRRRFTSFSKARKNKAPAVESRRCTRCPEGLQTYGALPMLPCGHSYCGVCLRNLFLSAIRTAKIVPLTCCKIPVPCLLLKELLNREEQSRFMQMTLRLDAERGQDSSCLSCGGDMANDNARDSQHSLEAECATCRLSFCGACLREIHPAGQACPADWALDVLRELGEHQAWVRCDRCRRILGFPPRTSHMTCHCHDEVCCTCGGAWATASGCVHSSATAGSPACAKSVDDDAAEERCTDNVPVESADAASMLENLGAEARSTDSRELQELRARQLSQQSRFFAFEQKQKWMMWTRHGQRKVEMLDQHMEAGQTMKSQHLERINAMEDRHVAAEMELRESLAQERKSCLIRLRHMEQYCGTGKTQPGFPARRVTERDLRQLSQQYDLRDDMGRMHEARINVMREKQARQLEGLEKRQREAEEQLASQHETEMQALEASFASDEARFQLLFSGRKERLMKKWMREEEELRARLTQQTGQAYGPLLPPMSWPSSSLAVVKNDQDVGLSSSSSSSSSPHSNVDSPSPSLYHSPMARRQALTRSSTAPTRRVSSKMTMST